MKKIMALCATAIIATVGAFSAEMASQPWVIKKLDELHTNIVDEVNGGMITNVATKTYVNERLSQLRDSLKRGIEEAEEIMASTNDPYAMEKAYQKQIESAMPLGNYLIDAAIRF